MLAQHVGCVDIGADRLVLVQVADLDHGLAGQVEHQAELGLCRPAEPGRRSPHRSRRRAEMCGRTVAGSRISPMTSILASAGRGSSPAPEVCAETSVMTPIRSEFQARTPTNRPTVTGACASASSDTGISATDTFAPRTETTCPHGVPARIRRSSFGKSSGATWFLVPSGCQPILARWCESAVQGCRLP